MRAQYGKWVVESVDINGTDCPLHVYGDLGMAGFHERWYGVEGVPWCLLDILDHVASDSAGATIISTIVEQYKSDISPIESKSTESVDALKQRIATLEQYNQNQSKSIRIYQEQIAYLDNELKLAKVVIASKYPQHFGL